MSKIASAYRGGADIVQLRSKELSDGELYRLGVRIRALSRRFRKLFFVNDRPDIALAAGADGIHLGQDDLPVARVRRLIRGAGRTMFVGLSTHSLLQAKRSSAQAVDYIGVGPVFATPTKPGYRPVGLGLVSRVARCPQIRVPFVVIGGIDFNNLNQVLTAGARRVAVVRAVFQAEDPNDAARRLRREIDRYSNARS